MHPLEDADIATVVAGRGEALDEEVAAAIARRPIDCVETEYPHWEGSVESAEGPPRPTERHPSFYGCFDWHSAVHAHWSLVRSLRLVPDHPEAEAARERLDARLDPDHVAAEVEYLREHETFERPYGWAWLLRLVAECDRWEDDLGARTRSALAPLEELVVERVESEFLTDHRPRRVGTHGNSAFALRAILEYAEVVGDASLADEVRETARSYYLDDRDAPVAYEPLGWDFCSPTLVEADLLRRVLDPDKFPEWFDAFLPDLRSPPHDSFLEPVDVDPGSDGGVELHLVGLNLSKARCLAGLAAALDGRELAADLRRSAERYAEVGLGHAFTDDYAGAHWLASFVLALLTWREDVTGSASFPAG